MNASKFVSSLLPQFPKNRLQEDIRMTTTELTTITIPQYKNAIPAFKSPESKKIEELARMYRTVKGADKSKPLVTAIHDKLVEVKPVLEWIDRVVEDDFEIEVIVAGITLQKATVLRLLELATFVSAFALRLLNYLYILESTATGSDTGYTAAHTTPKEIKLIETHIFEFSLALHTLAQPVEKVDKTLKSIPEILVNARGQAALASMVTADVTGAFQVQGFTYNPIYHVGMMVATWQGERYKRNADLKMALELRKLHLERARSGTPDPGLDQEIEVVQSRIDRITDNMTKVEESVK